MMKSKKDFDSSYVIEVKETCEVPITLIEEVKETGIFKGLTNKEIAVMFIGKFIRIFK